VPTEKPCKPPVLVVEDERDLRRLLSIVLSDAGFSVRLAANGTEAVAVYSLHREEISLVLLDMFP
jgi:two-component system cell cycle sensor histidine kinase/response regulator CckA